MSLRDRLAAKQRRRVVVSVEVSVMEPDQAEAITTAQAELLAALTSGKTDVEDLREAVEQAQARNRAEVAFTACTPDEFEKVAAAYPAPAGGDGGLDWQAALPVVAALCADDEDLQDDQWWAEQLTSGTWGYGERMGLWQELLSLNTARPAAHIPKG